MVTKPTITLSLKQANAILRVINSEYNDALYMLKDKEIDKAVTFLTQQIASIESNMREEEKKEYDRKNRKCWYCGDKGTIRNGICSGCLMRN